MQKQVIEINGCEHYTLGTEQDPQLYYGYEVDLKVQHPLGAVYKAKGILDTPIRMVRQPNNSVLFFNINEWNNPQNPFYCTVQTSEISEGATSLLKRMKESLYGKASGKQLGTGGGKQWRIGAYPSYWQV